MKERKRRAGKGTNVATSETNATGFEVNPFYERLLEMQHINPSAYQTFSAATHFAVAAYVKAKQAMATSPHEAAA
ncbi:MAG: hypothetical protein ACRD9R_14740 [Pyrinomonadaceae bacterium]